MQEYYIKRANECEETLKSLQARLREVAQEEMQVLQGQIEKVTRELNNYRAAITRH